MTMFYQAGITIAFGTEYSEDELWQRLDKLGHHSPTAQLHRAEGWLEQGLENQHEVDAGIYSAAEIVVMAKAIDGEDIFDGGRRLAEEVFELFGESSLERVELLSMNLGDPENLAYAGGKL